VTAGFLHRAGRTASAEDQKMTDARVEEHRNLASRSTRPGCWTKRAGIPSRGGARWHGMRTAHFFIGLVALKQTALREAMEALRLAAEKAAPAAVAAQSRVSLRAARPAGRCRGGVFGGGDSRTHRPARVRGWGVVALKQGDHASAADDSTAPRSYLPSACRRSGYWARRSRAAAGDFETAEQVTPRR